MTGAGGLSQTPTPDYSEQHQRRGRRRPAATFSRAIPATRAAPIRRPSLIGPATPTASITNSPVTYNGSPQTATVACLGGGTATLASGGSGTNAGSYPATVDCAASTNYTAAFGLAAGNFVINPATPTASITNSPVTYNGSLQTATVACLGGGAATLASGGTGTDAGSYPATVDCAGQRQLQRSVRPCRRRLRDQPGDADGFHHQQPGPSTTARCKLRRSPVWAAAAATLGQRRHGHQCRLISGHG